MNGQGCASVFVNQGCFESDLTIPSAPGALPGLVIYLRIDRTRHIVDPSVTVQLVRRFGYYSKSGEYCCAGSELQCHRRGDAPASPASANARPMVSPAFPKTGNSTGKSGSMPVDNGRYVNL